MNKIRHRSGLRNGWLFVPVLLVLVLGACGGGSSVRYYLVDPVEYTGIPVAERQLAIEILDVHVPQYLERVNIATRGAQNQLYFSQNNQWGDNLRKNLLRTLATNLTEQLSTNDVATPLNRSMSLPDYRIQVDIEQFERDVTGTVKLVARWQISARDKTVPITTHKAELASTDTIQDANYDGIVAAMQELYGRLSEMIAVSVRSAESAAGTRSGT